MVFLIKSLSTKYRPQFSTQMLSLSFKYDGKGGCSDTSFSWSEEKPFNNIFIINILPALQHSHVHNGGI